MSTKERTGSAGRTVGIVIILLCLAGAAAASTRDRHRLCGLGCLLRAGV